MNVPIKTESKIFLHATKEAWLEAIECIEHAKRIILCTHENSDCDGLGSESAIYSVLKKLGKEVVIMNPTKVFDDYFVIPFVKNSIIYEDGNEQHIQILQNTDLFILLDTNHLSRARGMKEHVLFQRQSGSLKVLCIDHHLEPENFADVMVCDAIAAATAELIFLFIKEMEEYFKKPLLDKNIATAIYAGLMTDTASFRLPKVSPRIHRIVADLLAFEISPTHIYECVYQNLTVSKLKLIGEAIGSIKMLENGRLAYIVISQEILERTGGTIFDTERLFDYLIGVRSVKIAMLFVQINDTRIKLSLRSKDVYPINEIARTYKGGGHRNAAGCVIDNTLENAVMDAVEKTVKLLR